MRVAVCVFVYNRRWNMNNTIFQTHNGCNGNPNDAAGFILKL